MITFYTRSRPHFYTSYASAIDALEQGSIRDEIISAEMKGAHSYEWLRNPKENEAEYRVRIVKDLRDMAEPLKLDQPILVQEQCSYFRTYKRRISSAALQALMVKEYNLPLNTSFIWVEDNSKSGVTVVANYSVVSSSTSTSGPEETK